MAVAFSLLMVFSARAEKYVEISLDIETFAFKNGDTNDISHRRTYPVTCVTGLNKWRIDSGGLRGSELSCYYDGTNVYERLRQTEATPTEVVKRIHESFGLAVAPFEVAKSNVTINIYPWRDGCPRGLSYVNLPWLAFCSGTYLRRAGRVIPSPYNSMCYDPFAFGCSDETQAFEGDFGLPSVVNLSISKRLLKTSVQREDFRGSHDLGFFRKGMALFHEGEFKFCYSVTDFTNFLGENIPLRFEFFGCEAGTNYTLVPTYSGIGRVRSIHPGMEPHTVFADSLSKTVQDWRFSHPTKQIDALTYQSTNDYPASTNDPDLQRKFAEAVRKGLPKSASTGLKQ